MCKEGIAAIAMAAVGRAASAAGVAGVGSGGSAGRTVRGGGPAGGQVSTAAAVALALAFPAFFGLPLRHLPLLESLGGTGRH